VLLRLSERQGTTALVRVSPPSTATIVSTHAKKKETFIRTGQLTQVETAPRLRASVVKDK
jgi:hypothetical protein